MAKIYKDKGTESISRNLIFDNVLSDRARFVYCFMMAKPDNWDFYVKSMCKELGYSEDTLHKYINELINRGWLTKVSQSRNEQKKFGAVDYVIHETRQEPATDGEKSRDGEKPSPKKAVTENFRDGKITPQKDNIDNKEIKDLKEKKEEVTSTIVDVPNAEIEESFEGIEEAKTEKKSKARKSKYTPERIQLHNDCKNSFLEFYKKISGVDFYWQAKDATAVIRIIKQIQFCLPEYEREDLGQILTNFQVFIAKAYQTADDFTKEHFNLALLSSKFNEIYFKIKNGKYQQHQNARDDEQSFRDALEQWYGGGKA